MTLGNFSICSNLKKCVLSRFSPTMFFEFHVVNTTRILIVVEPHMAIIQVQIQENLIESILLDEVLRLTSLLSN